MDLLGQENNTPKPKSKGKKMVLNLLILSIVLLVVVIALMYVVKKNQPLKPTLYVNNESKPVISDLIIDNAEDGKKYVSLKDVSALIGYQYLGGEYPEYKEISTKGYFQNSNQIIGFELGSNKIYKTVPDANTDFQYYDIKNKIIQKNDKLYIELQDFNETCQAIADYSSEKNQTTITTGDSLMTQWEQKIIEAGTYKSVSKDFENQKALFQGLIVVGTSEKNDGNYGVIDTNMKEIITPKFKEMKFDEYTKNFIVKGSDNQYGVISKDGKEIIVEVKYDSVRIINYNPVLYEVKLNNKYGVIINISSTNGIDTPYIESVDYDASKAGLISLSNNLANYLAPYVRVNTICPGWINTNMNKNLDKEFINKEENKILLGRFGNPNEVAELVFFLVSDNASYINNSIIRIDGGKKC